MISIASPTYSTIEHAKLSNVIDLEISFCFFSICFHSSVVLANGWLASGSKELILIACWCSLWEYPAPMFLTIPPTPKKSKVNLSDPPKVLTANFGSLPAVLKSVLLWRRSRSCVKPSKLLSCPLNMEEFTLAREFINPWRWLAFSIPPPLPLPKLKPKLTNEFCLSDEEVATPLNKEELLELVVDPIWEAFWSNAVADICEAMFSGCNIELLLLKREDTPEPTWSPMPLLLSSSGINKPEEDDKLAPVLLEKKLMLKRLLCVEELLVLVWRSGSCISPCKEGLFGKHAWFESGMYNAGEGIGCPKEQVSDIGGILRCSNLALVPSRNTLLESWFWFCTCDRPKLIWLFRKRLLPAMLGCLALSWASASQKALWVIKLSRLQQIRMESNSWHAFEDQINTKQDQINTKPDQITSFNFVMHEHQIEMSFYKIMFNYSDKLCSFGCASFWKIVNT